MGYVFFEYDHEAFVCSVRRNAFGFSRDKGSALIFPTKYSADCFISCLSVLYPDTVFVILEV